MDIPDLVHNNLAISIISLLVGALITAILTKLQNRSARLRYSTVINRIALAADDPVFGNVRTLWKDQAVRNLYMASVEIENSSGRDFENVDLKIYTSADTFLLNELTSVVGTPYIVNWSNAFKAALAVPANQVLRPDQLNVYHHSREYRIPVLNRDQLLQFNYLCTKPNDDLPPTIFASTQLKGARLVHQNRSNLVLGVPVHMCVGRGLVISAGAVIMCGMLLRSVWVAALVSVIVGLFAQIVGAVEYRMQRWLARLIAG